MLFQRFEHNSEDDIKMRIKEIRLRVVCLAWDWGQGQVLVIMMKSLAANFL